jgi:hypothetical protein
MIVAPPNLTHLHQVPFLKPASVGLREHDAHEIGGVPGAELFHDAGAMNLDGARTDPELAAGFLVRRPVGDQFEHLVFPRGSRVPGPEIRLSSTLVLCASGARQRLKANGAPRPGDRPQACRVDFWLASIQRIALRTSRFSFKAISSSLGTIAAPLATSAAPVQPMLGDPPLFVAISLAAFAVLFGTRRNDATEHQHGLVLAVAVESIVTFAMFDGPADRFARALDPGTSQTVGVATKWQEIGTVPATQAGVNSVCSIAICGNFWLR